MTNDHSMTDNGRLEALQGKVLSDVAGALGVLLAHMGDETGVYAALEENGPVTPEALAAKTGLNGKYLREWLHANAANGYVEHDPATRTFSLTPEQAVVFAAEGHPACMQGFFQAVVGQMEMNAEAIETFRSGRGRPWGAHSPCCFCGVDRFFKPGYAANLIEGWLPSLGGVREKLEAGARVADVGCGYGSSTILMAKAFPNSTFYGIDAHGPSIEHAQANAREAGAENVRFETATAKTLSGGPYDLVCVFDALHDMGDPLGAAARIREALAPDGTFMVVEPLAGDEAADNMHPLGAIYYAFSTMVCTPASLSQEVGLGLGAQAGQRRLTSLLNEAGFGSVRRTAETPVNMVLEARV